MVCPPWILFDFCSDNKPTESHIVHQTVISVPGDRLSPASARHDKSLVLHLPKCTPICGSLINRDKSPPDQRHSGVSLLDVHIILQTLLWFSIAYMIYEAHIRSILRDTRKLSKCKELLDCPRVCDSRMLLYIFSLLLRTSRCSDVTVTRCEHLAISKSYEWVIPPRMQTSDRNLREHSSDFLDSSDSLWPGNLSYVVTPFN